MATGIILAGGAGTRMPGDKAFMEVAGRRVIDIQLEILDGLFGEMLIVTNTARVKQLAALESRGVRVVEEPVGGKGPLGGILSGLMLSGSEENFVLACDMPFIKRDAARFVVECLAGFQVAVPRTPEGLEPLHAAYRRSCEPVISRQLDEGNLKVTDFYAKVALNEIPWDELKRFDPEGRLLLNINSPEDMKRAAGMAETLTRRFRKSGGRQMPEDVSEKVLEAVKNAAVDGRISCDKAQALAGELGVPIPVIGSALDLAKIKIIQCQLGCF